MSFINRMITSSGRLVVLGALMLGLSLTLAACGDSPTAVPPTVAVVPPAATTSSSSTTDTAPPPAGGTTIEVSLFEWGITPKDLTAPAGAVTFHVVNKGKFPHNFVILNGSTQIAKSKNLTTGQTEDLSATLPSGTLSFQTICDLPGHKDKGMVGTLAVK